MKLYTKGFDMFWVKLNSTGAQIPITQLCLLKTRDVGTAAIHLYSQSGGFRFGFQL